MPDLNEQLRAVGVSRDAESPSGKGVLVSFNRAPTDDELRTLHDQLRQHGSAAQAVAPQLCDYGNADDFVEAYEDWKAQQRNAEVGAMIYNGNTVSYMYSKAKNYGNVLVECCKLLGGEGHVLDRIKALIAERGALRAAPPVADAEGVKAVRDELSAALDSIGWDERFPQDQSAAYDRLREAMTKARDDLDAALSRRPAAATEVAAEGRVTKNRDRDQLIGWLLRNPMSGSALRFAGPLESFSPWLSQVRMVDADGGEWTLVGGLREGYMPEQERTANLLRIVREELAAEQPAAEQARAAHVDWRNEKDGRPAAARSMMKPMQNDDGKQGWYFDNGECYIDVEREPDGKYSVYFKLRSDKSETYAEGQPVAAGNALTDGLFGVIRAFGYTTSRQTAEIVEAIEQHLRAAPQAAQGEGLTDADENAPWLTLAHMICADAGIPVGHITDRLKALRDKLEATRGDALTQIRAALHAANNPQNGPITDTIWMPGRPETLFDFIDSAIAAHTRASDGKDSELLDRIELWNEANRKRGFCWNSIHLDCDKPIRDQLDKFLPAAMQQAASNQTGGAK